ncbi:helix-turn-helix domain-containing protein [Paucibacter sp. DJ2R-2]|uniref:helix-turn-helix domain-containing protein n=1 Tax=Paucibacter sp. DJ2R-2 TaxID=2893558 RepID=UPI0021E3890E|nr:helix-turn-helix transcriptional regulator [Paucibacter sp. DJ2R-2]MCV2436897.1 helix-turn-helix domain-containing protein [Paucibacter sp. DJ2R-2]
MDLAITFGRVLRDLRKQAGLTQEQLGFEAELERNYISMLERGERQPTLTTLMKLSKPLRRRASQIVALVESAAAKSNGESPSKQKA